MLNLPRSVASVWTSNPKVADVYVNAPRQINLFGKNAGEATVIATAADGSVVYGANVRVNQNISSINEILHQAMPEFEHQRHDGRPGRGAQRHGRFARRRGAGRNAGASAALNPGVDVTKSDVRAQHRSGQPPQGGDAAPGDAQGAHRRNEPVGAEAVGVNLLSRDSTGGTLFGIGRGDPGTINVVNGPKDPATGTSSESIQDVTFNNIVGGTTLGLFGKILGLDVLGTLDLLQNDGFVTTLAEPNLTALSGETASFLAGGEFPIPVSQALGGAVTIEYKQYGVGLAFTPIVLGDGRISMRVRPEVSELSDAGSVKLSGFTVPALTTRRAETTVELGSGQSFMIAGLLQNNEHEQHREGAVPRRHPDPRRAVPLDQATSATKPSW